MRPQARRALAGSKTLSVTSIEGTGAWLNTSPEIAVDPSSAPLLAWLLEHFPKLHSSPPPTLCATLMAAPTSERPVTIATIGLDAIVHEPVAALPHAVAVVLLNTGAEHHLGPGREWVALARRWAADGRVVLRLDLGGLAESPAHSVQTEQETYGAHAAGDLAAAVEWLRARGHARMVVVGMCSGAYAAIEAGTIVWSAWPPSTRSCIDLALHRATRLGLVTPASGA